MANLNQSGCEDLIMEYIKQGLKENQNMLSITLNENVMEKVHIMAKLTRKTPEEVVNDTLWENLRKITDVSQKFDGDRLWDMLEHDNPEGDDILDELSNVNKLLHD